MTVEIGKMRSRRMAPPSRPVAPAIDQLKIAKGYGHLMFWPFAVVIIILGTLPRDVLLMCTSFGFAIGMAWLGARVPYLAFVCFYQAMISMSGGAYMGVYGRYPGGVADQVLVPMALAQMQLALFVITTTYWMVTRRDTPGDVRMGQATRMLKVTPLQLFVILLILFAPEWLRIPLQPSSMGGFRQIVLHVVNFRFVIYGIFFINVLRVNKKKHYLLLIIISLYIALPLAVIGSAAWSSMAILALMFTAGSLVFGTPKGGARLSPTVIAVGSTAVIFLAAFGLIWEGGMKLAWRTTLKSGYSASMVMSISEFASQTQGVIKGFDLSYSLEQLTSRMSSGIGFSSLVIRNVPASIPHAQGERMLAAVQNLVPRILFPNKQDLGGDSWLVRKYANVQAAGDESGSSIGLGYISELYIDYGVLGVIGGSAGIGLVFGFGMLLFRRFAGGGDIGNASLVILLYVAFTGPDASLTKMFSTMVFGFLAFAVMGHFLYRYMYVRYRPVSPGVARTPNLA